MSKYNAKIRYMKSNLYKRPRSQLGMYLNIDMHKHHSREYHTHFRTHTYISTRYRYVSMQLHQAELTTKLITLQSKYLCERTSYRLA